MEAEKQIKISDLIDIFKSKANESKASSFLLKKVTALRDEYLKNKDKICISIEIDTDDDFSVNSVPNGFKDVFFVSSRKSIYSDYVKYIDGLVFHFHESGQYRVDDFKKMAKDCRNELLLNGEYQNGGNQTISVRVLEKVSPVCDFLDMKVRLDK